MPKSAGKRLENGPDAERRHSLARMPKRYQNCARCRFRCRPPTTGPTRAVYSRIMKCRTAQVESICGGLQLLRTTVTAGWGGGQRCSAMVGAPCAHLRSSGSGYQSTCTDRSTAHVVVRMDMPAAQASFSSMLGGSDSRASAVSCGADLQPHASRRGAGARRRARSPNRSLAAMGPVRRRLCRRTGGGAVPRRQQTFPATLPTPGAWSAVAPELAPLP